VPDFSGSSSITISYSSNKNLFLIDTYSIKKQWIMNISNAFTIIYRGLEKLKTNKIFYFHKLFREYIFAFFM